MLGAINNRSKRNQKGSFSNDKPRTRVKMAARSEVVAMDEQARLRALAPSTHVESSSTEPRAELPAVAGPAAAKPGFADLEAAVELVRGGLATRVILTDFEPWPGLLWQIYQLSDETGLLILATPSQAGGQVDIVVSLDQGHDHA
jgi:hypothetical protein